MIPEPNPDDPDDPYGDFNDDLSVLLPDRGYRNDMIDPLDPLEF